VILRHASGDTFTGTFPLVEVVFQRDAAGEISGFKAGNVRARDVLFERLLR